MSDCLFCKIVAGDVPCAKVYEDENVFAFLDIGQVTKGHTLVIPKQHHDNLYEITPESATHVFQAIPKIANAIRQQFNPVGINLLSNTGEDAGQSIFHFHAHLIPRYGKGDGFGAVWKTHTDQYSQDDLQQIAESIANGIK